MTGSVKFYNGAKGYGFLIADADGADVFFHVRQTRGLPEQIEVGLRVSFEDIGLNPHNGREEAKGVRLLEGEKQCAAG